MQRIVAVFIASILVLAGPPALGPAASSPGTPADLGPEIALPYTANFLASDALKVWKVYDIPGRRPSKWEVTKEGRLTQRVRDDNFAVLRSDGVPTLDHTHITVGSRTWKDYEVLVTIRRGLAVNDGALGVLFGYQGPQQHYRLNFDIAASGPPAAVGTSVFGSIRVERRDGDRYVVLGQFRELAPEKVAFRVRVAFAFGRIVVWVNDRQIFNLEEGTIASGKAGLFVGGAQDVEFGDFQARPLSDRAAVAPQPRNILSARAGAGAIVLNHIKQGGILGLIDEPGVFPDTTRHDIWRRSVSAAPFPHEVVFRFPRGMWARLDRLTFVRKGLDPAQYPREVEAWTSRTSPLEGFTRLVTITLGKKDGEETVALKGAVARYLKLRILSNHGHGTVGLSEVRAIGTLSSEAPEGTVTVAGQTDLQEAEANDTPQTANALPLGKTLGATLSAEGDKDVFKVTVPPGPGDRLRLIVDNRAFAAPEVAVTNAQGAVVEKFGPDRFTRRRAELLLKVSPGDYWVTVSRFPASMVIIYDDSDSMQEAVAQTRAALPAYLDKLAGKVAIKLMRYTDKAESISEFSADPAVLRAALDKKLGLGGRTDAYAGIRGAYKALEGRAGSRVILWVFDEWVSGAKSPEDWQRLFTDAAGQPVRLYIMGVLRDWADYDGVRALAEVDKGMEITEITGGQFLVAPTTREIAQVADRILADLTGPSRYALRADWIKSEPEFGEVLVKFAPEVQAISRNLEIILDASGSMNAKLGTSTRFAVAKQVLTDLVKRLPPDINVSLRVFGHRKGGAASCQDTELLVPPGRGNGPAIISKVNALRARGETPLVANLLLAAKDLAAQKAGTVVAITDGEESCGGNVQTVAQQLQAQGVQLVVNIVGFNLPSAKAVADWKQVAQSTGGRFFDAKTAGELSTALREAVKLEYVAIDATGKEVGRAQVGQPLRLPEGTYSVVVKAGQPVKVEGVKVSTKDPVLLTLHRSTSGWSLLPAAK